MINLSKEQAKNSAIKTVDCNYTVCIKCVLNDVLPGGLKEIWRITFESGRFDALKRIDPSPLQVWNPLLNAIPFSGSQLNL